MLWVRVRIRIRVRVRVRVRGRALFPRSQTANHARPRASPYSLILEWSEFQVSSLVIRFIRALPEGLFNMRATQALISAKANVSALSVVVSALSLHSRQLLARLFRHLETMVRSGVCNAGELARHLSPHLGRFSEEGIDREGEEAKELVAPIEAMIGFYTEVFGKDKAPLKL